MQYVYDNIRELRNKREISQKVICDKLRMQQAGYSTLEKGNTQLTIERLKQIADFFEVPITYFIDPHVKDLVDELIERNRNYKALTAERSFRPKIPNTDQQAIEHHQKVDRKNESLIKALENENKANKLLVHYLSKDLNAVKELLKTLVKTPSIKKQIKSQLLKEIIAIVKEKNLPPLTDSTSAFPLL